MQDIPSKEWGNLAPGLSFDLIGDLKTPLTGGWNFSPRLFLTILFNPCRLPYSSSRLLSSLPCLVLPAGSPWRGELDKLSAPRFIRKSMLNDVRHNLFPQRIFVLSQEFAASAATDSQIQNTEIWDFFLGVYVICRYPPTRKKHIKYVFILLKCSVVKSPCWGAELHKGLRASEQDKQCILTS